MNEPTNERPKRRANAPPSAEIQTTLSRGKIVKPTKANNPEDSHQIDTSSGAKKDCPATKKKSTFAFDNLLYEKREILRN